jgi:hypothetical protein
LLYVPLVDPENPDQEAQEEQNEDEKRENREEVNALNPLEIMLEHRMSVVLSRYQLLAVSD